MTAAVSSASKRETENSIDTIGLDSYNSVWMGEKSQ